MAEWCQNPECSYKKNQSQMRGNKGGKYYQSNKAHQYYYNMFCSQGCFHSYFKIHKQAIQNAIPEIGKQTVPVENAWEFISDHNYTDDYESIYHYYLVNKLMGVKHEITREQAQLPEDITNGHRWVCRPDSEAKPLAEQLGLIQS